MRTTMTDYPVKIRWRNSSKTLNKIVTRELEGGVETVFDWSEEDFETVCDALINRQKTNVVVRSDEEVEMLVELLESHIEGLGHPAHGGTWADQTHYDTVTRRIQKLEDCLES